MASELTKPCPICDVEVKSFFKPPESCMGRHKYNDEERACSECWEAYLSQEVEEKSPEEIRCMFCPGQNGILAFKDLKRLARKGTIERYEEKLQAATHYRCQNRCWASKRDPNERNSPSVFQLHDRKEDGRVFACKFCDYKTCIDCERPEHNNETCEEYRARAIDIPCHAKAEADTAKKFKRCPSCAAFWSWDKKGKQCGRTKCEACKFRFCGNCMIPWVGEGSAYLLGKLGHKEGCHYGEKEAGSGYALKKRHESNDQARARSTDMYWKRQEKAEEKAKKKAAEGESEGVEEATAEAGGEMITVGSEETKKKVEPVADEVEGHKGELEDGVKPAGEENIKKAVKKQGTKRKAEQMEDEVKGQMGIPRAKRWSKPGSKAWWKHVDLIIERTSGRGGV